LIFVFFLSHRDILQLWQCVLTPWSVHKGVLVPKATPSKIIMLKESSMLLISSLSVLSVRCSVGGNDFETFFQLSTCYMNWTNNF
jgi:hypothetical protein